MGLSEIILRTDTLDALETLADSERGRLFTALLSYARTGEAPRLTGSERHVFPLIRSDIDRQRNQTAFDPNLTQFDPGQMHAKKEREEERKERSKEKKEEEKEKAILADRAFDTFWEAYPRKVKKKEARKKFQAVFPKKVSLERLLTALEEHKHSEQWKDVKFIPHPSTWLNQERWEDEIDTLPGQEQSPVPPPKKYETRLIDGEWVDVEVEE